MTDGAVLANCTVGYSIGSETGGSGNRVAPWASGGGVSATNITLSKKMFLGWSESSTCAEKSCLTAATCPSSADSAEASNQKTYYAAWVTPTCTADSTSVSSTTLSSVTDNKAVCSATAKAGYYGSSVTGGVGVTNVTVSLPKCANNWNSAAGSTVQSDCKRSIVLNKRSGSGKIGSEENTANASVTCSYNTDCTLSASNALTRSGYTFNGWSTSNTCTTGGVTTAKITDTAATVTYYACWSAQKVYIKWTGVDTPGTATTFTALGNNAYRSEVSYEGAIITPQTALKATGQTLLGWKFVK